MEFTLSLALLDFLPVLFTGVGLFYIGRLVSLILPTQGRISLIGGTLVVAGGFFRAIWKLLMALSGGGVDVNWMEESLFVFMTPGYLLLGWSVWQTMRALHGKTISNPWVPPLALIFVTFLTSYSLFLTSPGSPAWERILLSMMVAATLGTGLLLIALAFQMKLFLLGGLFVVNLLGIFILNGLARVSEQTISLHWIAEGINTVSWLAYAVSAWGMYRHILTDTHNAKSVHARPTTLPKSE
jgi:hypothetical protein